MSRTAPYRDDAAPRPGNGARIALVAACVLLGSCARAFGGDATPLRSPALVELSGLAPATGSTVHWGHNDHGNAARLYRVGADGADLGAVAVEGARNRDWEDLAWMDTAAGRCLLVGDIGDNLARREHARVYFVPEPAADADTVAATGTLTVRYPDGARDAEGLAFDPRERALYLLSKRETPPVLYRLPVGADCAAGDDAGTVAERVAEVVLPPPPPWQLFSGPHFGLMFNLPTALDISTDGARLAVLAYGAVVVYDRADGEDWASALRRRGARVVFPPMEQAEALSLSADGTSALIGSEGEPGHMQRVVLPAFDAKRPPRAQPLD